jgi:type I restriction enzyme M protein
MLPFVVLRRLECALEKNKDLVIERYKKLGDIRDPEAILNSVSGHNFYNVSPFNLSKILQDPNKVASNLNTYIHAFSPSASEVLDKYGFPEKIKRLESADLLYQIVAKFADLDLSEESVTNEAMGYIFEELLRKFSEMSNETAGEHYTPREVIRLMVNLLFIEDSKSLTGDKPIRSIYDPACGTGGMLSIAEEHLHEMNPNIVLNVFGQELNDETWAIARSDLMIKGQDPKRIARGNSLTDEDGHAGTLFDYCISNPPYGVDWKKYEKQIKDESEKLGFSGRYGAGLPRVNDGSFLFIQHMLSKMKSTTQNTDSEGNIDGGTRMAIILSGTPMYSGQPGSGESEIRKWILENDWLEGIVALPDEMFYNTEIGTYIWILTNRKNPKSKGLIRLIDARSMGTKMIKSLGDKKNELSPDAIEEITRLYSSAATSTKDSRIAIKKTGDFAYARITVERPLRKVWEVTPAGIEKIKDKLQIDLNKFIGTKFLNESKFAETLSSQGVSGKLLTACLKAFEVVDPEAAPYIGKKGTLEPDTNLRSNENINLPAEFLSMASAEQLTMLKSILAEHLQNEISPFLPDAWIDIDKTKIGYEIPFSRNFYTYKPPRPVLEILNEIEQLDNDILKRMAELH